MKIILSNKTAIGSYGADLWCGAQIKPMVLIHCKDCGDKSMGKVKENAPANHYSITMIVTYVFGGMDDS